MKLYAETQAIAKHLDTIEEILQKKDRFVNSPF